MKITDKFLEKLVFLSTLPSPSTNTASNIPDFDSEAFIERLINDQTSFDLVTNAFKSSPSQYPVACVVLHGEQGSGKTEIAKHYAYSHLSSRSYERIFWLNAESRGTLLKEYNSILFKYQLLDSKSSLQQNIKKVKDFLQQQNCLLVYDGAENCEWLKEFVPSFEKMHIIITTNSIGPWSRSSNFTLIEIKEMREDEALKLLTGENNKTEPAVKIIRELNFLAKEIVLVKEYIHSNRISLEEFCKLYPNSSIQSKVHQLRDQAWKKDLEEIQKENPSSFKLFHHIIFFPCAVVPESLLKRIFLINKKEEDYFQARCILLDHGLIKNKNDFIYVNTAFQDWARIRLADTDKYRYLKTIIKGLINKDAKYIADFDELSANATYLNAFIKLYSHHFIKKKRHLLVIAHLKIYFYYSLINDLDSQNKYLNKALEYCKTATCLELIVQSFLAELNRKKGNTKEAIKELKKIIPKMENHLKYSKNSFVKVLAKFPFISLGYAYLDLSHQEEEVNHRQHRDDAISYLKQGIVDIDNSMKGFPILIQFAKMHLSTYLLIKGSRNDIILARDHLESIVALYDQSNSNPSIFQLCLKITLGISYYRLNQNDTQKLENALLSFSDKYPLFYKILNQKISLNLPPVDGPSNSDIKTKLSFLEIVERKFAVNFNVLFDIVNRITNPNIKNVLKEKLNQWQLLIQKYREDVINANISQEEFLIKLKKLNSDIAEQDSLLKQDRLSENLDNNIDTILSKLYEVCNNTLDEIELRSQDEVPIISKMSSAIDHKKSTLDPKDPSLDEFSPKQTGSGSLVVVPQKTSIVGSYATFTTKFAEVTKTKFDDEQTNLKSLYKELKATSQRIKDDEVKLIVDRAIDAVIEYLEKFIKDYKDKTTSEDSLNAALQQVKSVIDNSEAKVNNSAITNAGSLQKARDIFKQLTIQADTLNKLKETRLVIARNIKLKKFIQLIEGYGNASNFLNKAPFEEKMITLTQLAKADQLYINAFIKLPNELFKKWLKHNSYIQDEVIKNQNDIEKPLRNNHF